MAGKTPEERGDLLGEIESQQRPERGLGAILRTVVVLLAIVFVLALATGRRFGEIAAVAAMLFAAVVFLEVERRGHPTAAGTGLVFSLIVFATMGLLAFGSVRGVAMVGIFGAIAAGGMLLPPRTIAAAVALGSLGIGTVIVAQNAGTLAPPDMSVGLLHWAIYSIVLAAIGVIVHYGHGILLEIVRRLRVELRERERAERTLREREAQLAHVFRASPAAVVISAIDDGRVIDANESFERMFRVSRAEILGRTAAERGVWADPEQREAFVNEVRAHGRAVNFSARFTRRTGEPFDALISGESMVVDGERRMLTSITDISVETAGREALRKSEERFSLAFRTSPIAMSISRMEDGRYLDANETMATLLGLDRREMIGSNALKLGVWADPDDRRGLIDELAVGHGVRGFDAKLRNSSGRTIDCRIWANVVEMAGERCMLAAVVNVTEQKREQALILEIAQGVSTETGEAFFRSMVTHLQRATGADMVIVGEIVDGGVRTLAILRDGAIVPNVTYAIAGTPCERTSTAPDICVYPDRVAESFPDDASLARDGIRSYIGAALSGPRGEPIGVINVLSREPMADTERIAGFFRIFAARAQAEVLRLRYEREILGFRDVLEQRVAERTSELQQANRELEAFSYSVSHDLRAPLRAVDGYASILLAEAAVDLGEAHREMLARIVSSGRRMGALVDQLLELARVGRHPLRRAAIDLSAMARGILAELAAAHPERTVATFVADGLVADGDAELLRSALGNLLGNAWKFTSRTPDARIEVERHPAGEGRSAFVVRDNGAGFDPRHADKLFTPFRRLHRDDEFPGDGIGLATVRRVVERHGGRVWSQSEETRGAAFFVELPDAHAAGTR